MSVPTPFGVLLDLYFCTLEVYLSVHLKKTPNHTNRKDLFPPATQSQLGNKAPPTDQLGLPGRRATGGKETSLTSNQENRRVWGDNNLSTHECHNGAREYREKTFHSFARGTFSAQFTVWQSRTQYVMGKAFRAMFCSRV